MHKAENINSAGMHPLLLTTQSCVKTKTKMQVAFLLLVVYDTSLCATVQYHYYYYFMICNTAIPLCIYYYSRRSSLNDYGLLLATHKLYSWRTVCKQGVSDLFVCILEVILNLILKTMPSYLNQGGPGPVYICLLQACYGGNSAQIYCSLRLGAEEEEESILWNKFCQQYINTKQIQIVLSNINITYKISLAVQNSSIGKLILLPTVSRSQMILKTSFS